MQILQLHTLSLIWPPSTQSCLVARGQKKCVHSSWDCTLSTTPFGRSLSAPEPSSTLVLSCESTNSCKLREPKSIWSSSSRGAADGPGDGRWFGPAAAYAGILSTTPTMSSKALSGSVISTAGLLIVAFLKPEPFGGRVESDREEVEACVARDSEEDLGLKDAFCEAGCVCNDGLRPASRLGAGE